MTKQRMPRKRKPLKHVSQPTFFQTLYGLTFEYISDDTADVLEALRVHGIRLSCHTRGVMSLNDQE